MLLFKTIPLTDVLSFHILLILNHGKHSPDSFGRSLIVILDQNKKYHAVCIDETRHNAFIEYYK